MYGIHPIDKNSYEQVFRRLDQLYCWQKLLGFPIGLGQAITSPFRVDSDPGCYLQERNGIVLFKDFADKIMHNKTVVSAYSHIYQCTVFDAVKLMELDLFPSRTTFTPITIGNRIVSPTHSHITIEIQPFVRNNVPAFPEQHLQYWKKRNLNEVDLQSCDNHQVLAVHSWAINGHWKVCKDITFAYVFKNNHVKIYVPDTPKKFIASSTTSDDIWQWNTGSEILVIDKSFKDGSHTHKMVPDVDVWAFQAEGHTPSILPETSHYKKVIIKGDNDRAGKDAVTKLIELIPIAKSLFYPMALHGVKIKDTDDLVMNGFEHYAYLKLRAML